MPVVTSQTCRSWTSTTPASCTSASPIACGVEARGRGLHEDPARLAQQAVGGPEHQRRDQQRCDPVGAVEPPDQDQRAGDRGCDEGKEVGDDMEEGPLDVEAAPLGPGEHPRRHQVHHDPDQSHDQDQPALHIRRVDQPADALEDDQRPEQQQRDPVDLGGEDLGPSHPVGEAAGRRPLGQPQRGQRQPDRNGVREHVARVGDQRQGGAHDPRHELGHHEADDQRERAGEAPRVGVREVVAWRGPCADYSSAVTPKKARDPGQGGGRAR